MKKGNAVSIIKQYLLILAGSIVYAVSSALGLLIKMFGIDIVIGIIKKLTQKETENVK